MYYDSFLGNLKISLHGWAKTDAGYKRDVGYFHISYEEDQGLTHFPENLRTPLVPQTGHEVLKQANYQIVPATVSSHKWPIYKNLLSEPFNCSITIVV